VEASIRIDCSPADVYDMIADVTRMGEWSPSCTACFWLEATGPEIGAWFIGQNMVPENWEQAVAAMAPEARDMLNIVITRHGPRGQSRSKVIAADRGHEFAFTTFPFSPGGPQVLWSYAFADVGSGSTEVRESWTLLPEGVANLSNQADPLDVDNYIAARAQWALDGIQETLAALKRVAESG
jgi:Polyketide cyclase / dehydrase and lipid transport